MRLARFRFDQRAIVDDQVQVARQQIRNGPREVKAPPGDQQNFDASLRRLGDRAQVLSGELRRAVEQRPVDIHRNQFYRHTAIVP